MRIYSSTEGLYERSMNSMKTRLPVAWRCAVGCARSVFVRSPLLLLAALSAGCSLLTWTAEFSSRTFKMIIPGMDSGPAVDPVAVQEQLLRSADIFLIGLTTSAEQLRRDGAPISQAELQTLKISYTTTILALVTGPNALTNLLDMIGFITRNRLMAEGYWLPEVYGESARPFLDICREAETQLWQLTTPLLTAAQQEELRQTLHTLHQQDRDRQTLLPTQALSFVTEGAKISQKQRSAPASVFSLFRLDPLSGLDPATRELAETRLFAQRALFIAQRMPDLMRWEMELFTLKTAEMPQLQQLLTNSTQLAAAADRFSQVAAQLPRLAEDGARATARSPERARGRAQFTRQRSPANAGDGRPDGRLYELDVENISRGPGAVQLGPTRAECRALPDPRVYRRSRADSCHGHRAGGLAPSAGWVGGIATPRTGIVSVQCLDTACPNQREGSSRLRISEGLGAGRARLWCGARYGPDLPCVECAAVEMAHEGVSVNTFATHR